MPVGAFRRAEARQPLGGGGAAAGAVGDKMVGKVGGEAVAVERRESERAAASTPDFGGLGLVAVTDGEVALVSATLTGMSGPKPHELIARHSLSEITAVELGGAWPHISRVIFSPSPLRISFSDGSAWQVEVPRIFRRSGKKVARLLRG